MTTRILLIATVTIYGILSIIAAVAGISEEGVQGQLLLFAVAGLALIATPWLPNQMLWLLAGLIGFHIAALWQGSTQDSFQWSHHIVRAIVSITIIALAVRAEEA